MSPCFSNSAFNAERSFARAAIFPFNVAMIGDALGRLNGPMSHPRRDFRISANQLRPDLACYGQLRPNLYQRWLILLEVGQAQSDLRQFRSDFKRHRPLAKFGSSVAKVVQSWPKLGKTRADKPPMLSDILIQHYFQGFERCADMPRRFQSCRRRS